MHLATTVSAFVHDQNVAHAANDELAKHLLITFRRGYERTAQAKDHLACPLEDACDVPVAQAKAHSDVDTRDVSGDGSRPEAFALSELELAVNLLLDSRVELTDLVILSDKVAGVDVASVAVVLQQLVVEHLLAVLSIDSIRVVDAVLDDAHHLTLRGILQRFQLFVKRVVRRAQGNRLPRGEVHAQFVSGCLHAVFAGTLGNKVGQFRKLLRLRVRHFVEGSRQVAIDPQLEDLRVESIVLLSAELFWVAPDAVAHVEDRRLTRARVRVDHVKDSTALTREAQDRCTEGSSRSECVSLKTRATVEVEDFLPLLEGTRGHHVVC